MAPETEYMIAMVWDEPVEDTFNAMLDLWTHRLSQEYDGFGPLIDVKTFRNFANYIPDQKRQDVKEGSASGNTIVLLAAEEEARVAANGDLKRYLEGPRPQLPARLKIGEDFYLID